LEGLKTKTACADPRKPFLFFQTISVFCRLFEPDSPCSGTGGRLGPGGAGVAAKGIELEVGTGGERCGGGGKQEIGNGVHEVPRVNGLIEVYEAARQQANSELE
jgi:hypothetical protein